MYLRHIGVCVCKCVFMAGWCALAGVCCVFVAYVFTHASICVSDGVCACLGGHWWGCAGGVHRGCVRP